jgi:hypothetical protein
MRFTIGMFFRVQAFALLVCLLLVNTAGSPARAAWTDRFSMKGDLRYRYTTTDKEGSETRDRHRIRARLGISCDVIEDVKVHVRLATGGGDATSTNQDLSGGFSAKNINLDQAYVEWKATKALKFYAGKSKNPFVMPGGSELIWDGDLNPEGLSMMIESQSTTRFYLNAAYLSVDERKSDTDDGYLAAGQAGVKIPMGKSGLNIGGGYYQYINQEGYEPYGAGARGNSLDDDGLYPMDFSMFEGFIHMNTQIGDLPFELYGHYVVNTEADEDDTGYLAGMSLGKVKDAMSWQLKYNYRRVEKDAVVGAFCHSDFIGGGTNGKGHNIAFALGLSKNISAAASYFMNDIGLEGTSKDFKDLQLDLVFKF